MMGQDEGRRRYIQGELAKVKPGTYRGMVQAKFVGDGQTNWLSLTAEQYAAIREILAPATHEPTAALLPNRLYYCSPSEDYLYTPNGVDLVWFENKDQALREVGRFGKPIINLYESPV